MYEKVHKRIAFRKEERRHCSVFGSMSGFSGRSGGRDSGGRGGRGRDSGGRDSGGRDAGRGRGGPGGRDGGGLSGIISRLHF